MFEIPQGSKIVPHNIEAEQSVIGAMLLDKEAISLVIELVSVEDFYREDLKAIYECIIELFQRDEPVDLITVTDILNSKGCLEKIGGAEYIANLAASVPTTSNVKHYAKIVHDKSVLRNLIKACSEIANASYENNDVSEVLNIAEKKIFDISKNKSNRDFITLKEILIKNFDKIGELAKNKQNITGVPTGFIDIDNITAGLQPSDLILIAARPAMGKTSFALNIAQYAAMNKQIPVAIFSLEMSKEQLANRMLWSEALVESNKMRTGNLDESDWPKISRVLGPLSQAPIYIDDTPGINIVEMRAKCRRLKLEKNIGLVVLDYLQLMQSLGRSESRQQEISEISRSLKILAKELDVPVVALSQLSRAPETRNDHRPVLSDLRESGAIEQDADIVMFLYRDEVYNPDTEDRNIAECIISKHRNGSTGNVKLQWIGEFTKFRNLDTIHDD